MSASNPKIESVIENTFVEAIHKLTSDDAVTMISDLYIQADPESGELQIKAENCRFTMTARN
ncbi:MAG: hypothetical protein LUD02_13715 [Tannerellaceae bacterium]|nr:hypothetical protein [Tannerellaceae bacterium]MCD8265068.1 hypothetical protein [Tannerellaceae bacterium]